MNLSEEELLKEKEYLKKTLQVINEIISDSDISIQQKKEAINEMKRYIWENNGVLDDVEVSQGYYNVNTDVSSTNEQIKNLEKLKKSLISPYFGRIDFEDGTYIDSIYIGINGIMKDLNFYVYDWRTPIASMFYNYGVGKASYFAPKGEINGEIKLKRQYKIKENEILRCFDSNINIDDEYLQEILSNSSSEKMTNIVNTIQQEQNEIIRNMTDKYLLVQGIAGSGKTSVALHRIAYLLYRDIELTSNNILIFSPNNVFSEYISNVLPELGEENVLQTTYSDFANAYINDFKEIESFTSFIERYYRNDNMDNKEYELIKYKMSDNFKSELDQIVLDLNNNLSFTNDVLVSNKIVKKDELNKLLKEKFDRLPLFERVNAISEYICDKHNISYKKYGKVIYEKLCKLLNDTINIKMLYSNLLSSDIFINKFGENIELSSIGSKNLKYEDLLPMMYLNFELYGYPRGNQIKHVIIDEAQDYTLLQVSMLKKIFKNASFTILGDINQTINPYYKYDTLEKINEIFDNKAKYIELTKTYRSTEEIIKFTNNILNINNVCSVRNKNNIPVDTKKVDQKNLIQQITNDIQNMKDNGIKRIAIITKNSRETEELYNILKDNSTQICILNDNISGLNDNTVILPSYVSKGLEFDGVIAYTNINNQYGEKDMYLFYVVCTRAQHKLIVYNQEQRTLKKKNI